jgi:hypothetical protein
MDFGISEIVGSVVEMKKKKEKTKKKKKKKKKKGHRPRKG